MFIVYSDVVSNKGQFPSSKGDAKSFKSTGPLCRYSVDLMQIFKLIVLPEHKIKLQLDEQVTHCRLYQARSVNNLQNSVIPLVFQI